MKWSTAFERVAQTSGLQDDALDLAKTSISLAVEKEGLSAVRDEYLEYVERISQTLEIMLDEIGEDIPSK